LRKRLKTDYDDVQPDENGDWPPFEEEQLLICPPRVQGYALLKKMFVEMDVNKLHEIPAEQRRNEEAFSKLVLPTGAEWKDVKNVIQWLIEYHTRDPPPGTDIPGRLKDLVDGKGQGLVILLHG
jgi:hypothetical protein